MTSSSSSLPSSSLSSSLAWRQTLCSRICPGKCLSEWYQHRRPLQYLSQQQQQRPFAHNRKSSTKLFGSATVIHYALTSVIVLAIGLSLFASWKVTSQRQQELVAVTVPPPNSNQQQPHLQRAIFYNIFVATTDPLRQIGLDIVKSQLQLLRLRFSHLLQNEQQQTVTTALPTVYYTLIGSHQNATMAIQSVCRRLSLDCHETQYLEQGDEGATLDALYRHCQQHPHPETTLVTYLHNKGSWHPSEDNTKLRALQTKAVFSNECQTLMTTAAEEHINDQRPQCNICSARFSLMPHFHMPGNMFTARCDYVNGLVQPSVFPDRMQQLIDHVQEVAATAKKKGQKKDERGLRPISLHDLFVNKFPYRVGLGRYAFEHWIASSPDVRPCDVFDGPYRLAYENLPSPTDRWIPHLQEAGWIPQSKFPIPGHTHQWYCGRGRLLEFQYLYGRLPPPESFVWKLYGKPTRACPHPVQPPPHPHKV